MPEVHVYMAAGRTQAEKTGMMLGITQALVENLGCPQGVVTVQIIESPAEDKMKGGETFAALIGSGKHSLGQRSS